MIAWTADRRFRRSVVTVAAMISLFSIILGTAQATTVIERAARSVARVSAMQCEGAKRVGTGFVWRDRAHLVTALHVVAGCRRIAVYFESTKTTSGAQVVRVLRQADLALLQVDEPSNVSPLRENTQAPATNAPVNAIGYFENAPTLSNKNLKVALNSTVLKDMLPSHLRQRIRQLGSPSLTVRILRLDGPLLPGLSGGPIVDDKGDIVAIASGGLKNGFVGVSWGIATSYLKELVTSARADAQGDIRTSELFFSQAAEPDPGSAIVCGNLKLTKVRTATITELLPGSDNQVGLLQIAESFGKRLPDVENVQFSIYQNLETGAAIAVPVDLTLRANGEACRATDIMGRIEMRVSGTRVASPYDAQEQSVNFENILNPGYDWYVQPDVNFSYLFPFTRPDGLVVNRKSFIAADPSTLRPPKHLFETLMMRNNAFAGIATINHFYNVQQIGFCRFNPQQQVCAELFELWDAWMRMVFATHLSTFPIY